MLARPKTPATDGGLTDSDKAMYAKLYCCDEPVSVEDQYYSPVRFTVSPNPTAEVLTIQLSDAERELSQYIVRMVDMNGRDVMIKPLSFGTSWTLNVSSLSVGVYIVEVTNNDGDNFSTKVVIER
jgi:fibronectin type 3 domain-containing protein